MTTIAIWNPAAGSAPDEGDLRAALGAGVQLIETTPDDPGDSQTRRAIADGARTIVACGGDGTVRACLDALRHSGVALDIVPLGTGNLLATNLGIPPGLEGASSVPGRPSRTIDAGVVNGETFAVMAGTGFDALMIGDADEATKAKLGTLAYIVSGVRNLRSDLVPTTVEVDGRTWFRGRTTMVLVGNHGTVTGGLEVFPDASPDDGLLDVAVLRADGLREWASVMWRLVRDTPQRPELVDRTQGRRIVVTTSTPRAYELDGEARDPVTRVEFTVDPAALQVHTEEER